VELAPEVLLPFLDAGFRLEISVYPCEEDSADEEIGMA